MTKSYRAFHLLSILVLWTGSLEASSPALTFLTPDLEVYPQFFSVVQGQDHLLYLGGSDSLLRFDGSRWTRIDSSGQQAVRSLLRDSRGRIWVGGYGAFGYLQREATGADRFIDLTGAFRADLGDAPLADIWSIVEADGSIFFQALRHIFRVDLEGRRQDMWQHPGRFSDLGVFEGQVVVQWRDQGLKALKGNSFELLPGADVFVDERVDGLFALPGGRLLVQRSSGLAVWQGGKVESLSVPELPINRLNFGLPLADGVVAFSGDDGVLRVLDVFGRRFEEARIEPSFIANMALDSLGRLLVATDRGIAILGWPPEIRRFDTGDGVTGPIYKIVDQGDAVLLMTSASVYRAEKDAGRLGTFEGLPYTDAEAWDLLVEPDLKILAESFGLIVIDAQDRPTRLGPRDLYPRYFKRSRFDSKRVWIGTEQGLALLEKKQTWQLTARFDELPNGVDAIVELGPNELLIGTKPGLQRAVFFADDRSFKVEVIDRDAGPPQTLDDRIVVGKGQELYRYENGKLLPDVSQGLGGIYDDAADLRFVAGESGELWAFSQRSLFRRQADGNWLSFETSQQDGVIHELLPFAGGALVGTTRLLLQVTPLAPRSSANKPGVQVQLAQRLRSNDLRPLPLDRSARLPIRESRLEIDLGLPVFSGSQPTFYQVKIEGLDDEWSAWSQQSTFSLAQIPPGAYVLQSRARLVGQVFDGKPFAFEVYPPWFQTRKAQASLGVLALGLGTWVLTWRLRRRADQLDSRNRELDGLVRARTSQLETANRRLLELANKDGLTNVANRRHFDEALRVLTKASLESSSPLSLILVDVDHFKAYNDTHGHLAGDERLKEVAAQLEANLRKDDALVARVGGEEFAVLLPDCSLSGADRVAERLRVEIAQGGHVTISLGVATWAPRRDLAPAVLVAAADKALYRAKNLGRNRVETASETDFRIGH